MKETSYIYQSSLNQKTMKKLMAMLVFLFVGFSVQAQEVAKMEFESDVIDYGDVEKGSDGLRTFTFTNTGNIPLVISDVSSSCGCTVPKKPEEPVLPGEKGEIQVKYDTKRVGPIRKTITVYSNAEEKAKSLKIKGKVIESAPAG